MISEKLLRASLWASLPFNLVAGYALATPTSALGQLIGPGEPVPIFHALFLGSIIMFFGLIYGWLAYSPIINKGVLTISTLGKFSAFSLASGLWLLNLGPIETALVTVCDLIFGIIWALWLLQERKGAAA